MYDFLKNFSYSGKTIHQKQMADRYMYFNWNAVLSILVTLLFGYKYMLTIPDVGIHYVLWSLSVVFALTIANARLVYSKSFLVSVYTTIAMFTIYAALNVLVNTENMMRFDWFIFAIIYAYFLVGIRAGVFMFIFVVSGMIALYTNVDLNINLNTFASNILMMVMMNATAFWLEKRFEGDAKKLLDIDETIDMLVADTTAETMMKMRELEAENEKLKKVKRK